MPLVLIDVSVLMVALVAIALALMITDILKAVAGLIPSPLGVFDWLKNGIYTVASAIATVLGKAEAGVDAAIGASWHLLARFMRAWWHEIERQAIGYVHLAEQVLRLTYAHSGLRALAHSLEQRWHGIEHGVRTLEREYTHLRKRVGRLEAEAGHGIDRVARDLAQEALKEYRGIDQLVTRTLPNEIAAVEGDVVALGNFIGAKAGTDYTTWAEGLVVAALAGLGLSGLRCNTLLKMLGKGGRGCGLWQGLDDLLGLFLDAIIFTDLCQLTGWINQLFSPIEGLVVGLISDAANAACAQRPGGYVYPTGTAGSLPPAQTLGATP